MRIELENLRKRQADAKAAKDNAPKTSDEAEADEKKDEKEDNLKQKPNNGNGGYTEKYVWH